jgi:hypothetical protein
VALTVHQAPDGLARWWGPEILSSAREPLERAVADPRAVVLVRGEWHRRMFVSAFGLPADRLQVLPASIPLPPAPIRPASATPREVLALTRLSAEKAAIVRLAAKLTRARRELGEPCTLSLAGAGGWRDGALAAVEGLLPAAAWRLEPPPANPITRLAAADRVVTQGLTTLEAAALERRAIVARTVGEAGAGGAVLTAGNYDDAARDPFGDPSLEIDPGELWREAVAVPAATLAQLRRTVAEENGLAASTRALAAALSPTKG